MTLRALDEYRAGECVRFVEDGAAMICSVLANNSNAEFIAYQLEVKEFHTRGLPHTYTLPIGRQFECDVRRGWEDMVGWTIEGTVAPDRN
jgi:hypothetical protein